MAYTTKKLSAMPYAQATVRVDDDGHIWLISYETIVAGIDPEGWLMVKGLYGTTTRKHLGAFVKEYANVNYQIAKMLYLDKHIFNIHTGEIR